MAFSCLGVLVLLFLAALGICRAQSNEGNEFFLVFLENYKRDFTCSVFVTTPEDNPVSFTISSQFTDFYEEGVAMPGQVVSYIFNRSFALLTTTERGKAIIVKAEGDHKLVVYGANEDLHTTDAFLALPPARFESQTYKYITAMATPFLKYHSLIGMVASENNTVLSITPNTDTTIGSTFSTAGSTTQIMLQKYETLLIRQKGDLTGTRVVSDKPISFITGHRCTNVPHVPPKIGHCDHLVEQIPPVQNWGKRFATVPLKTRQAYDRFKIVAGENYTTVQIECTRNDGQSGNSTSFILQEGGFKDIDIPSTDYCWIEGDKRIILLQFSVGQEVDGVLSDPFMAMIPPVEQYSNGYTLATVSDGVQNYTHFMNLYIPKDFFQPSKIFLNDQSLEELNVTFTAIQHLGVTEVYGAQLEISGEVQTLKHLNKLAGIGVMVYGFGKAISYGYCGGLRLEVSTKGDSVCPVLSKPMNGYYGNTKSVSTSGELLVVECNEGCVLAEGKYLTCPIRNIWSFKEAEPKCEGDAESFDPPTKLALLNISESTISMMWSHSDECFENCTIVYEVTWQQSGDGSSLRKATTNETYYIIDDLTPTIYLIGVDAIAYCFHNVVLVGKSAKLKVNTNFNNVGGLRSRFWIAISGVLASLLIISWTIFIVTCVVAACVRKRSKKESDHPTPSKDTYNQSEHEDMEKNPADVQINISQL